MTLEQFVAQNNGKSLDYDGYYGAQCVDLVLFYMRDVTGLTSFKGNAKDWYYNYGGDLATKYDRITNDPTDVNQVPQRGDIVIFNGNLPGSGGYGHIDVFLRTTGPNAWVGFDQNWGGQYCHEVAHNYQYVLGWLRSKKIPAPGLQPYQRIVGANGVNYRERPDTSANIIKEFAPGEVLDFKGYVRGGVYNGNNIWLVGKYTGGYCWSGAFTDQSTHDLPDLTQPTIPPTPTPIPPTPDPPYSFTKDLACVTEVIPAALGNFEYGNFPAKPEKVVIHDFGTKGVDTIGSVINHFTKPGVEVSAHFVVSGKRIVQMVALKDRAYHAGPNGNGFVGIESDPNQDQDTINSTRTILEQLKAKYGSTLTPVKHSSIMATQCGDDINLANYQIDALPPTIPPGTTIPPTSGFTEADRAMLTQISNDVKQIRVVFK